MNDNTKCNPVPAILLSDCEEGFMQDYGRVFFATKDCVKQLYKDSIVVIPEPQPQHEWCGDYPSQDSFDDGYANGWNDCLDELARLNGLKL